MTSSIQKRGFLGLLVLLVLIFSTGSKVSAQYGLLWHTPKADSLNFPNNQYECPIFDTHWNIFDIDEIRGNKQSVKSHTIVTRDFNNNGYCDLFVAFAYPYHSAEHDSLPPEESFIPYLLMLFNPETGELEDASHLIENNVGQPHSRKVVSGDLNNNGVLDFAIVGHPTADGEDYSYLDIVLSTESGWKQVNLNQATREYGDYESSFEWGYYHGMAMGDVNNNGFQDLVVSNWTNDQGLITFLNNKDGTFNKFYGIGNPEIEHRQSFNNELYDVNGNGCLDIVMSGGGDYGAIILYGSCDGYFGETYTKVNVTSDSLFADALFQHFVFTDFNNNGLPDMVAAVSKHDYSDWRFLFFENQGWEDGKVHFSDISDRINPALLDQDFYYDYASNSWGDFFAVYDINGNGRKDIVIPAFFDMSGSSEFFETHEVPGYAPTFFLINDGDGSYHYAKYPLTKEIKEVETHQTNDSLYIHFDLEVLVDASHHEWYNHEVIDFRGEIKDFLIYHSSEPFVYRDEDGVSKAVLKTNVREGEDFPHFIKPISSVMFNPENDTTYFRLTYKDEHGIEFPLSPLFIHSELNVDVEDFQNQNFALEQNFPNPFRGSTQIEFLLPVFTHVKLEVYTTLGEKISLLLDRQMEAGIHSVSFNGDSLPGGVYIYRLSTPGFTRSRLMYLLE